MAVVNNAAMKAEVHASFQIMVFLQLYARSGTAGLYGRSSFKRSLHTVLLEAANFWIQCVQDRNDNSSQ